MATKMYYLVENGQQTGPFSFEDLKTKKIEPETLIWFEGQEKWKKAKDLAEISPLLRQMPPPIDKVEDEIPKITPPPVPKIPAVPNNKYELASTGERLGGYLLTQVITVILFFAFGGSLDDLETSNDFIDDIFYAGLGSGIFNGIFYPFFSGNLGHKLLGIKVIKVSDGTSVKNIFLGYSREFLKGAFSIILFPLIWLLFDKQNQNLYDKISGTLVVKVKE